MKNILNDSVIPHVIAVAAFLVVISAYFAPVWKNQEIDRHDTQKYRSVSKEINNYREATGEEPLWTNSMFGGMPTYMISTLHPGNLFLTANLWFNRTVPAPINYMIIFMCGIYLLLVVLRVNPLVAAIGALACGFASYNITIIAAGHNTKFMAMGYMAPVLAGMVLAYRGKFLLGGAITALAMGLELAASHVQITYYLGIIVLVYVAVQFFRDLTENQLGRFVKASAVLLLAAGLGVGGNLGNLLTTYEYADYTIRGPAELTPAGQDSTAEKNSGLDTNYATAWSYDQDESMTLMVPNFKGGASTPLIVVDEEAVRAAIPVLAQYGQESANNVARGRAYFGNQTFTGGPFYSGAAIVFLFVLGFFLLRGPWVWVASAGIVCSLVLSWGRDIFPLGYTVALLTLIGAMGAAQYLQKTQTFKAIGLLLLSFLVGIVVNQLVPGIGGVAGLAALGGAWYYIKTQDENTHWGWLAAGAVPMLCLMVMDFGSNTFLHEHTYYWAMGKLPLFNKFRTPSMALVIAQLLIPVVAALALNEVLKNRERIREKKELIIIPLAITGGLCALMALMPDSFTQFYSGIDLAQLNAANGTNPAMAAEKSVIADIRSGLFVSDAWRSFLFIALAGGLVFFFSTRKKGMEMVLIGGLAAIVLVDLIQVDLRYLSEEQYKKKTELKIPVKMVQAYANIQADPTLHFRVFDTTQDIDKDGDTPYYFKSIGGYSAAKMHRFQDLVENQIAKGNQKIFDMLNTRYFLFGVRDQSGRPVADPINNKQKLQEQLNPAATGNAWFVREINMVPNPDAEMAALSDFDPRQTAIVDERFSGELNGFSPQRDDAATIELTSYDPKKLVYQAKGLSSEQMAVFSEIYYDKGWNAYLDGNLVPHVRANYILRAMRVPAGDHTIEFRFEPASYHTGNTIGLICSLLIIVAFAGAMAKIFLDQRKQQAEVNAG